jgi:hypothetical protein
MTAASSTGKKPATRGFAAAAERKKGRHALPPREERRARSAEVRGAEEWVESNEPAAAASAGPAASSTRMPPAGSGLVDADGRLVDATGRIGRIDANGALVSAGTPTPMGPGDSYARMRPAPADGRGAVPYGPVASHPRMMPANLSSVRMPGARPGPEDSYDRLPAVPPINDRLRSAGGGRGPADSSGRMRPVGPGMGPEDSYDRIPPVDRDGRAAAAAYGASGYYPAQRPGPSDSFDRLPPVSNQAYDPPQLNLRSWDGQAPGGRHASGPYGRPEDSYDRMPPARPNGHLSPVDSDGRMQPVGRQVGHPADRGPEDSYDRMPPARPEDAYDQFPPARRGPLGPVDSNGRLRPVQRRRH